MACYRLYCFSGQARITGAHDVEAETDAEAISAARTKVKEGVRFEVWQQDRLVGRFDRDA